MQKIPYVDTHTGGEPTRIVLEPPVELRGSCLNEMVEQLSSDYDDYRRAVVCEPRGSDVWVGAWLLPAVNADSIASVIFFNNVGYLGMCGHGLIGLAVALKYLGQIDSGQHQIDTPVGPVSFTLIDEQTVQIKNVASYRLRTQVPVKLPGGQTVHGDVAWGGNWFFLCDDHGIPVEPTEIERLCEMSKAIRRALQSQSVTGQNGAEIDHIDLLGAPSDSSVADSRNFVLCPGHAYDRSPCGTGTSAKLACLAADGKLAPGSTFRQQSITGSIFEGEYVQETTSGNILPTIRGNAGVISQGELLLNHKDKFSMGLAIVPDQSSQPGDAS